MQQVVLTKWEGRANKKNELDPSSQVKSQEYLTTHIASNTIFQWWLQVPRIPDHGMDAKKHLCTFRELPERMWELYPQPSNIKPMTHDRQPSPSSDVGAWTWPWQPGGLVAIHPQCPTPHTSNDHSQNSGTYSENLKRQMVQTCRHADCTWQITYNTMQAPFACWCKVQSSGRTDGSTMTCTGIICVMCNARVLIDMSWLADLQTIKNHEHSHWWIMNQLAAGSWQYTSRTKLTKWRNNHTDLPPHFHTSTTICDKGFQGHTSWCHTNIPTWFMSNSMESCSTKQQTPQLRSALY